MIKKTLTLVAAIALMCVCAMPAQAQFGKSLGKSLSKATKGATDAVASAAGDMAADMAANKVSGKVVEWMDTNNVISDANSVYSKRLTALIGKSYTSVDALSLNYKVYENPEINILAAADGSIRVYSGMMDFLTDDELVAVIANRIGHIANKDVRNALMQVASEDNASNAGSAQLEKMLSFSGDKLGSVVNELMQVPYTEAQCVAADKYAWELLKKNGSKTEGLSSALTKFANLESAEEDSEDPNVLAVAKFIVVSPNNSTRASIVSAN